MRTLLRLEYLFEALAERTSGSSEWDSREALNHILNITDILSRSDIKSELIKELERHSSTLNALTSNPAVDQNRLTSIMQNIAELLLQLKDKSCQPGQLIRHNDLMNSVKQRSSIPGGSCNFDLPGYHFWLNKSHNERVLQIRKLATDLQVIKDSIELAMHMIRNSTVPSEEEAENGFFQKPFDSNLSCQLVRVVLGAGSLFYPEISGGKHRFTIRFMQQEDTAQRPTQVKTNIRFQLHCCIL